MGMTSMLEPEGSRLERIYTSENFTGAPTWLTGKVLDQIGPVSFRVQLRDGRIKKRHVDHLRIRYPEDSPIPLAVTPAIPISIPGSQSTTRPILEGAATGHPTDHSSSQPPESMVRRSSRVRNPPDRLY